MRRNCMEAQAGPRIPELLFQPSHGSGCTVLRPLPRAGAAGWKQSSLAPLPGLLLGRQRPGPEPQLVQLVSSAHGCPPCTGFLWPSPVSLQLLTAFTQHRRRQQLLCFPGKGKQCNSVVEVMSTWQPWEQLLPSLSHLSTAAPNTWVTPACAQHCNPQGPVSIPVALPHLSTACTLWSSPISAHLSAALYR